MYRFINALHFVFCFPFLTNAAKEYLQTLYVHLIACRAIDNSPYLLDLGNEQSLKDAPFVEGRPVKILIHGYTGHRDFSPNTEIRPGRLTSRGDGS